MDSRISPQGAKRWRRIIAILGVVIAISVAVALYTPPIQQAPTPPKQEIVLALQNVEKGDIVRFGENNFRMVANRVGNDIHFKVPICDGLPYSMPISLAAKQATDVIKYNSTSVAWTNAAYILMTGDYVRPPGVPQATSSANLSATPVSEMRQVVVRFADLDQPYGGESVSYPVLKKDVPKLVNTLVARHYGPRRMKTGSYKNWVIVDIFSERLANDSVNGAAHLGWWGSMKTEWENPGLKNLGSRTLQELTFSPEAWVKFIASKA